MSVKVNTISDEASNGAERRAFIAAAWDRLHVMSKQGHVDRLRMQDAITKLIQGEHVLFSGTVPSIVWNKAVDAAKSLGVREE